MLMAVLVPQVVLRAKGADNARKRLDEGALEIGVSVVGEQTPVVHHLPMKDPERRVAADMGEGIAGSIGAHIADIRLDDEFITNMVLSLPLRAHRADTPAELMPHDDGVLCDVGWDLAVLRAVEHRLERRHAEAVRNDLGQDLIRLNRRQVELLQTQVILSIQANRSRFHRSPPFPSKILLRRECRAKRR